MTEWVFCFCSYSNVRDAAFIWLPVQIVIVDDAFIVYRITIFILLNFKRKEKTIDCNTWNKERGNEKLTREWHITKRLVWPSHISIRSPIYNYMFKCQTLSSNSMCACMPTDSIFWVHSYAHIDSIYIDACTKSGSIALCTCAGIAFFQSFSFIVKWNTNFYFWTRIKWINVLHKHTKRNEMERIFCSILNDINYSFTVDLVPVSQLYRLSSHGISAIANISNIQQLLAWICEQTPRWAYNIYCDIKASERFFFTL